jgi:prolyl-tRNA editing enzyme YbaK/EbsC (Cys-tRNA(Pro) deacylase)
MTDVPTSLERDLPPAAARFRHILLAAGHPDTVVALPDSARTAVQAAAALGTTADSIASSLVFGIHTADSPPTPLLIVTSGGHRVDTARVAAQLGAQKLQRVDAAFVRAESGYAIGGVAPIGWRRAGTDATYQPTTLIDDYLAENGDLWAAAGHPHCVFRTNYPELLRLTGGQPSTVA